MSKGIHPTLQTAAIKEVPMTSKEPARMAQQQQKISERDIKANSSVSASLALEATKKAYELRQAAYGAGNSQAREDLLAEAVNREIEAESFGKAAKYTRTGAFQGLASGAGLGVQPGAALGKLTGALVGGVVSTVGALVGGGIGSAYGAISGPFWDLGQMAGQGLESIIGDWLPNWEATTSQKNALKKLLLGAKETEKPGRQELEEMSADHGGVEPGSREYEEFKRNMTQGWIPNSNKKQSNSSGGGGISSMMPSMPSMPSLGFGGGSKKKENSSDNAASVPLPSSSSQKQQPTQRPAEHIRGSKPSPRITTKGADVGQQQQKAQPTMKQTAQTAHKPQQSQKKNVFKTTGTAAPTMVYRKTSHKKQTDAN
ncbi:hypothetical protein F5Y16DRAFT_377396 [Xylariaceae sp. FL0255]|nr:hypothetical protein F5Y16DRAFT_377396 [Xylariaceae sp. FL0255]